MYDAGDHGRADWPHPLRSPWSCRCSFSFFRRHTRPTSSAAKFTTMMGDFFGWALACLDVGRSPTTSGSFLAAAILNSFEQINQTAWYCLLIEDADPERSHRACTPGSTSAGWSPSSSRRCPGCSSTPTPSCRCCMCCTCIFSLTMLRKILHHLSSFCTRNAPGTDPAWPETKNVSALHMLGRIPPAHPASMLHNRAMTEGGGRVRHPVYHQP